MGGAGKILRERAEKIEVASASDPLLLRLYNNDRESNLTIRFILGTLPLRFHIGHSFVHYFLKKLSMDIEFRQ